MKYGYARVSTKDQNLDMQIDALERYGCQKIFSEHAKGAKADRFQWLELLKQIKSGDSLIIWKLDRMGRSLSHLISIVNELIKKNVSIISLNDPIDTSSIQGKFMFNIFASLAEFEKDLIRERTMAGLRSARIRGKMGGRPKGLSKEAQRKACVAEALYAQKELSISEIIQQLNISKTTLYKYLRFRNVKIFSEKISDSSDSVQ